MNSKTTVLLACLMLSFTTLASSPPPAGLIARWPGEGNANDVIGANNGTPIGGVTFKPGIVGQAFVLDGTNGFICTSTAITNPENFTLEFWLKTTTTQGGVLMGFGDSQTGTSSNYDRHIYLDNSGKLHFGVFNSGTQMADSVASYNDGYWHHVAAIMSTGAGTSLYVDGALVSNNPSATRAQDYSGWWRIGENNLHDWPSAPSSYYFNGLIDEVSIYDRALSSAEVQAIYNAGSSGKRAEAISSPPSLLSLREIRYDAKLSDNEARFVVDIDAKSTGKGEASVKLFEGDVALLPVKLPDSLRMVRDGNCYFLTASQPGQFKFKLDLVAKIQREEPWNKISFAGPAATIASVSAQAAGTNTEVQLLNGTLLEAVRTNGVSRVTGFLGADQTVALRWQGKIAEVARKALLTVDSTITAQLTPSVIKYTSRFHYDVVQGNAAQLTLTLPATQALTRLEGEQIRDWHTATEGERQTLTIEFIKPVENACDLTLFSEQAVEGTAVNSSLNPPQPLNVERESGSLTVSAEDTLVEIVSLAGLRQVNAPDNAVAAYRFNARPFTLVLKLKPIEPVISVTDRAKAQLEETRLMISHGLTLDVEKAGIYTLELTPQSGFAVAEVRGEGVEDWKVSDGRLRVSFSARVLGSRPLEVQLEQALKNFPEQISVLPLRVTGATKETAQIGAASAPGIRLRTATLSGLHEIPVRELQRRTGFQPVSNPNQIETGATPVLQSDEILAYTAEQPDWQLSIASERLAARIVADVFNLVTIGDGIVGGSATIRYSLVNQGVQEFKVRVPAQCKYVEFTGPDIRRKESGRESKIESREQGNAGDTNDVVWTIGLQDRAWGGYTLVVTYDFQFDPAKGDVTLPVGGIHTVDAERETGSIAVTTAANLQLSPKTVSDALHRVDETELSPADRSFVTRAVVLAWQYTGSQYDLALDVQRYAAEPVLEAVADRTQITSVLTEAGEMLTQASFMVKNNEKQFQRFQLPKDAKLWGCYVNGQPAKPERNNDWVLVPLPRDVDRDQAFAVDIMYAQTNGALAAHWSETLELNAPRTDVPNTYAEWQLFVPSSFRLSHFGGGMKIAQGTTYGLLDAWGKFLAFYVEVLREAGGTVLLIGFLAFLVIALVISSVRRGWNGVLTLLAVVAILAVLGAMLLPALASARRKAQRINSVNNLHQIGVAARVFAGDNSDRLPVSFDEMKNELGTDKITYDTETGQRYTYLGGGISLDNLKPESVLAYGPIVNGHCEVLFADGGVEQMTAGRFAELSERGLVQLATPEEIAAQRQREAVVAGQLPSRSAAVPPGGVYSATVVGFTGGGGGGGGAPTSVDAPPATLSANGAGGFVAGIPPATISAPAPTVAGIRSLRIELPQTGQPFLFTKVLNVRDEPLSIRVRIMPLHIFQTLQMIWQTAAFLFGLAIWWWQWRRVDRNSFILTIALALIIGSVCSLLVQWRALHDALIVGFPVVTLAVIAWLVWRYWPRIPQSGTALTEPPPAEPPVPDSGLPPVMAAVAFAFFLGANSLSATPVDNSSFVIRHSSIISASYSATVNDRVALLDATLQISAATAGEVVRLFGDDVVVQQFTVKNGSAGLVRAGNNIAIQLNHRGNVTLQIKMLVKIAGDVTKRRLTFGIPPALSSQVALALGESEADVDFPTAISFKRILDKDKTRVEAVIGSGDRIELLWTPRVKRAAEVAATVFCRNAALVTFGGGVVNVRATLNYQITQGELRQARVQLPAGQRLLRVEGNEIRTWEIKNAPLAPPGRGVGGPAVAGPGEGQILVVDLLKGVSSSWKLIVETEAALDALPATEPVAVPHALDVKRETGLVALQGTEELGLSVESASGLERVDAEEFKRADADKTGKLFSAFRFSNPEFALRVRAEVLQPEIEAVARNYFRVSAGQVALSATIDYTIKRAGLFVLRVGLPDGYRVERVTGTNIQQWIEKSDDGLRALEVTLKDRTSGAYTLGIELTRNFKELPKSLAIAGVHPLDTVKLTGFVAVSAEPGVAVKTESFDGLTEIPAMSLPDYATVAGSGDVLAYKFIPSEPERAPAWNLSVATEAVAAWVRAEVVNTFTLGETLVSGRALVRYDIANAPVKELRVKVPAEFKNVEIAGPNIRSREIVGGRNPTTSPKENESGTRGTRPSEVENNYVVWRVELQSPTRGFYVLTVTWDQPRPAKADTMELTGVSAEGVERETGLLAISVPQRGTPLQVSELNAADLQRVDTSDFPDWAGGPDRSNALTYRYVRPGYKLALNVQQFGEAEVLQALVDSARLTSVVADDGQMMTEMSLSVRNNGRQFLEVELPAGATVWSAFVAGQPVRPSLREGKLLLPIQQSGTDNGAMAVELTYVGTNAFPRTRATVGFVSPTFDVPLKNARWEIYLPPDYDYQDFHGTMAREAAAPEASSTRFSILDYSLMEQANKEQAKAETLRDVNEAQRQLASGNVREASWSFYRAKVKTAKGNGEAQDVKQLEKDLQNAQASNLINAQSDFTFRNSGQITAGENALVQTAELGLRYDSASAGQQSAKLQQAQEIVAAQVQPLHVNLPVRGVHYAFTQVLQTEAGRPMTIQMQAANTKAVSWLMRGLTVASAFLVLWGFVAVVSRITRPSRERMNEGAAIA